MGRTLDDRLLVGSGGGDFWRPAIEGAYDDYFDADNSADWTEVAVTGTATWAYRHAARLGLNRGVHGRFLSQTAGDFPAFLKSLAGIATGDFIQSAVRVARKHGGGTTGAFGIVLTDGTTDTANAVGFFINSNNNATNNMSLLHGTLTALTSTGHNRLTNDALGMGPLHLRLRYSAANTFQALWSLNGEDFIQFGADVSKTMTPTHGGFIGMTTNAVDTLGMGLYFHTDVA